MRRTPEDESAGALEHFQDAALYDHDYRRRRHDVRFYRTLATAIAARQPGPVLDLACGTGRLLLPLLRDGHTVVGLDHAPAMLAGASAKIARLPRAQRRRALLIRADLRRFAFRRRFGFAVAAFHSVQHLITDADLLRFFRSVRRALAPHAWLAFDVFTPEARFLARDETRRWDRTPFQDPTTGRKLVYTINHHYDRARRTLLMRMYYLPVDGRGRAAGPERMLRLCHRQLGPKEVRALLTRAGLDLVASYGDFAGGPPRPETEQQIYLARPASGSSPTRRLRRTEPAFLRNFA
jgi:SAM-dependent methyltransferase